MWWKIHMGYRVSHVYLSNAIISFNVLLDSGDFNVALESIDVFYFPDNYILTLKK